MYKIAIVSVCIFLCACTGFKLRSTQNIKPPFSTICIIPFEPYEPLQRTLRTRLAAQNVQIVREPSAGVAVLNLNKASTYEETLAVGSSGEVQRYKLSLSAAYSLKNASNVTQHTVVRSRELNRSNNMLLSNEGEEQIVKRELLNEVAYEILRQIISAPALSGTH